MKIVQHLAGFFVRQVVESASESVAQVLTQKLSDPASPLLNALTFANDKTWTTLELVLAGDHFLQRIQVWLGDTTEHRQLREALQQVIRSHVVSEGQGDIDFRRQALEELQRYRQSGLHRFDVKAAAFADVASSFLFCNTPQEMIDEVLAELQMLQRKLAQQYPALSRITGLQLPNSDLPLVASTFNYFLRVQIETDPALFQGLTTNRLAGIDQKLQSGFAAVQKTIQQFGDKLSGAIESVHLELQAARSEMRVMGQHLEGQNEELKQICLGIAQAVDQQRRWAHLAHQGDPKALAEARKVETDFRRVLLNSLLKSPHRQLEIVWPAHEAACRTDPLFYPHLAAWYFQHGEVRDIQEIFVVTLCLSKHPNHRPIGIALLHKLPPYQVVRIVDFIHGTYQPIYSEAYGERGIFHVEAMKIDFALKGLGRGLPRSLRTAIRDYLRRLEANPDRLDGAVMTTRDGLKRLYALLHIQPNDRAQAILFDRQYPADSRLAALAKLHSKLPLAERLQFIALARPPYRIAAPFLPDRDPAAIRALIETMSLQDLISSLSLLQARDAFTHPPIVEQILAKFEQQRPNIRVSTLKAELAAQLAELPEPIRLRLNQFMEDRIEAKGRITRPTALLVDKSGSMDVAIEAGMHLAALIATICPVDLFVYAFDRVAFPVHSTGKDLASWRKAFRAIVAGGTTACGAGIEMLRRRKERVEQIIIITDEVELDPPSFVDALLNYQKDLGIEPNIVLVRVPDSGNMIQERLRFLGIAHTIFDYEGDYYSLPNLVPLLTKPSEQDFLLEILNYPLPEIPSGKA